MEIVWLDHQWFRDAHKVGGKGASLGRLANEFPVPPAFCMSSSAFARWGDCRLDDNGPPEEMLEAVTDAYTQLGVLCGIDQPAVAVRSSAVDEDGFESSFAGQHDTFLNLVGSDSVARAIVRCWASSDSDSAVNYRKQSGATITNPVMGVLVQQMIPSDISGVAFSANPVSGQLSEIIVNSSWGLGESIVGGTVTPDTFIIDKIDWNITSSEIANKVRMTVSSVDGAEEVDVPQIMRDRSSMSDAQVLDVARLADSLEKREAHPVDIEWAFYNEVLYLLQCRPITTLTS